jgi:type IV pilus assembly protein PilB
MTKSLQRDNSYIGELLVRDGIITHEDLDRGLHEQKQNHEYLCTTLVRLGLASEEKIFSILSLQIGIPYISLRDFKPDPAVVHRMPGKLAHAFRCVLLRFVDDVAYVAMTDPLKSRATQEIQDYLGVSRLKLFLAGDADLDDTLQKVYG